MATSNNVVAIQNALISMIQSQMNSIGALPTLNYIGKTKFSENEGYSYCGIVIMSRKETKNTNHTRLSTITFGIAIITKSTVSLSDAYSQRESLVDDGNGNGIQPLLRSTATGVIQSLFPNTSTVITTRIMSDSYIDSYDLDPKQSNAGPWMAYCGMQFEVDCTIAG